MPSPPFDIKLSDAANARNEGEGPDSAGDFSMAEFDMRLPNEPGWEEDEPEALPEPVSPELLARRRQLRSWVGRGMVALAVFTLGGALIRLTTQPSPEPVLRIAAAPTALATALPVPVAVAVAPTPEPVASLPSTAVAAESLRDITLPPLIDEASLQRWSRLAHSATAEEFNEVDTHLAALVKDRASTRRDRSRLARAILWRERGQAADVAPVIEDLALHAKSPDVRRAARTIQKS